MPVFDSQRRFENELQSWSVAEKATTEPLEATKLHNQLQGYSQRHKDLVVLHNKDRKEIWRANRIPKWLDRAAQKCVKQKVDPFGSLISAYIDRMTSDIEMVLVVSQGFPVTVWIKYKNWRAKKMKQATKWLIDQNRTKRKLYRNWRTFRKSRRNKGRTKRFQSLANSD